MRTHEQEHDELRAFVQALPKAELHLHLEGSITPELALALATRHGVRLPGAEGGSEGLRAAWRFPDFAAFIATYLAISRCLQTADDLVEVIDDLAGRLVAQNVRHVELTFTPMTHVDRGVSVDALVHGLVEGRAAARSRGLSLGFVFDIVRSLPDRAAPTLAFARAVRRRDRDAVVGLGLGGPEGEQYPLAEIARVFARARAEGMHSLPHAGEQSGAASVRAAIELLGAERIGHGIRCLEDPALVDELVARGVALEVCPSSNVALGIVATLAEHPLPQLLAAGLRVSLASDDPTLFATDLVEEYVRCATAFGWSRAELRALASAGLEHAFVGEAERAAWRADGGAAVDDTVDDR
ncbi:MAG TPA: adenosine deaminase [Nannocystaceae bacterium]|nr:adenosine deaminase [Nannocystaceae bacterium]